MLFHTACPDLFFDRNFTFEGNLMQKLKYKNTNIKHFEGLMCHFFVGTASSLEVRSQQDVATTTDKVKMPL